MLLPTAMSSPEDMAVLLSRSPSTLASPVATNPSGSNSATGRFIKIAPPFQNPPTFLIAKSPS
ncbi:hypothetical protein V2O64_17445 [Verrucomicrobiaceae bacterium 227]